MSQLLKKIGLFLILPILLGTYFFFREKNEKEDDRGITVKRGTLVQEVSVTGTVIPKKKANLSYEQSGKVAFTRAEVGKKVKQGEILMGLDSQEFHLELRKADAEKQTILKQQEELQAQKMGFLAQYQEGEETVEEAEALVNQSKAVLKGEKTRFVDLQKGSRDEEILIAETKVSNANRALNDAYKNLLNAISDAYMKTDDSLRNKISKVFATMLDPTNVAIIKDPDMIGLNLSLTDYQLSRELKLLRLQAETKLIEWKKLLDTHSRDYKSLTRTSETTVKFIQTLADKAALAINTGSPAAGVSTTTFEAWKTDISTARNSINTAITSLLSAEEKLNADEGYLLLAQEELILLKSGNTKEAIETQESVVEKTEAGVTVQKATLKKTKSRLLQIQASIDQVEAKLKSLVFALEQASAEINRVKIRIEKTLLKAPFTGTITKKDIEVGEIATPGISVITIISADDVEIEAYIPEVDFSKMKLGTGASVTFDAYGNEIVFPANIIAIDPAETVIEGVSTYRTLFQFLQIGPRIQSGMTANITMLIQKKENVLMIPQRSVINRGEEKIVLLRTSDNASPEERRIVIGLKGSDGNIEVMDGLQEGDHIIYAQ